jgi:hypothetical protein
MSGIFRHKLLLGATAAAVAAFAGGAYAASQSGTNPRQAFLNDVAKRLNVSPSQLDSAVKGAVIDRLNAAVKAGLLTQAQANRIEQAIQNGKAPFFGGGPGFFGGGGGPFGGHGFGGPGGPGGPIKDGLSAAASYLGLSQSQLISDIRSGKSLAQIAGDQGKSVSGLKSAITDAVTSDLDKAVSSGQLTKSQEQDILSNLSSRIDQIVNGTAPRWGAGFRGHLRGMPYGPPGAMPYGPPGANGASGSPGLSAPPVGI